jgi:nucleotide-binding universal stress UspA family protein
VRPDSCLACPSPGIGFAKIPAGASGFTLLGVVEPSPVPAHAVSAYLVEEAGGLPIAPSEGSGQAYPEQVAERLRDQALNVRTCVLRNQPAAAAILEEAGRQPGELIALATHGRSGLDWLLLGRVADKVIRGATAPVLVYRPDKP